MSTIAEKIGIALRGRSPKKARKFGISEIRNLVLHDIEITLCPPHQDMGSVFGGTGGLAIGSALATGRVPEPVSRRTGHIATIIPPHRPHCDNNSTASRQRYRPLSRRKRRDKDQSLSPAAYVRRFDPAAYVGRFDPAAYVGRFDPAACGGRKIRGRVPDGEAPSFTLLTYEGDYFTITLAALPWEAIT